MEGRGTFTLADGRVMVGRFVAGASVGQGALWSADGTLAWELEEGSPVGSISLAEAAEIAHDIGLPVPEPCRYEGEQTANRKEGHGKHTTPIGVYIGQWKNDRMEGHGVYTYADGDSYEGGFKAGEMEGRGTYSFANGDVYEGEYLAGRMEGRGVYTYADGRVVFGCFKAGAGVGQAVGWSADGREAWELQDSQPVGIRGRRSCPWWCPVKRIPVAEAVKIIERVGLPLGIVQSADDNSAQKESL